MFTVTIKNPIRYIRKGQKGNPFLTPHPIGVASWLPLYYSIIVFLCSCAGNTIERPLHNASPSVEHLATRVVEAVYHKDLQTLKALSVTAEEYRNYIWPQSPVYGIKQWEEHYDFIWGQHHSRSTLSLSQMLSRYGGKKYSLVHVLADEITDHTIYKAHREVRLRVTTSEGREVELKLCGSIMEMDGQFKIISYKTH